MFYIYVSISIGLYYWISSLHYFFIFQFVYLFVCVNLYLFICKFDNFLICLFIHFFLFIFLFFYSFIFLFICTFVSWLLFWCAIIPTHLFVSHLHIYAFNVSFDILLNGNILISQVCDECSPFSELYYESNILLCPGTDRT